MPVTTFAREPKCAEHKLSVNWYFVESDKKFIQSTINVVWQSLDNGSASFDGEISNLIFIAPCGERDWDLLALLQRTFIKQLAQWAWSAKDSSKLFHKRFKRLIYHMVIIICEILTESSMSESFKWFTNTLSFGKQLKSIVIRLFQLFARVFRDFCQYLVTLPDTCFRRMGKIKMRSEEVRRDVDTCGFNNRSMKCRPDECGDEWVSWQHFFRWRSKRAIKSRKNTIESWFHASMALLNLWYY